MPIIQNGKIYNSKLSQTPYSQYLNNNSSNNNGFQFSSYQKAQNLTNSVLYNQAVLYNNWYSYKK